MGLGEGLLGGRGSRGRGPSRPGSQGGALDPSPPHTSQQASQAEPATADLHTNRQEGAANSGVPRDSCRG